MRLSMIRSGTSPSTRRVSSWLRSRKAPAFSRESHSRWSEAWNCSLSGSVRRLMETSAPLLGTARRCSASSSRPSSRSPKEK
eukprot:5566445-Lingulodinium_polyedra.AAC.1